MVVLLVRHAAAGDRQQWEDDDRTRPLSDKGYAQAVALAAELGAFNPVRVVSSPARRCIETVAPLAEQAGVVVEEHDALFEGETRAALDLLRAAASEGERGAVVLCSHGDVIPYVMEALDREEAVVFSTEPGWKKASTWVLDRSVDGWSARYIPPPAT